MRWQTTAHQPLNRPVCGLYYYWMIHKNRTVETRALRDKGIKPVVEEHDDFLSGFNEGYEDTRSKASRSSPVDVGYTGRWEAEQTDTAGSGFQIKAWNERPKPQTYAEYLTSYEDMQSYLDDIIQEMARYEFESGDSHFMNSQWYEALSREEGRVREQLSTILEQHPSLQQAMDLKEYLAQVNEDDFSGQFASNFDVGHLTELTNAAYNQYLTDPTADNKAYADYLTYVLTTYSNNNAAALKSEETVLPLFSQTAASYLPQLGHQLEYGAGYGLAGATGGAVAGSVVPGIGTAAGTMTGLKGGYVYGVGKHSFEQVRGSAFRAMIEAGIDEDTARAAATDEALVSALIEASEAGVDVLTLGLNGWLGKIGDATARKAASLFGKYGINLLSESAEEGLQQSVSYANLDRVQNGEYDPNANGLERVWNLITGSGNTLGDAVTGKDTVARNHILDAMGEGRRSPPCLAVRPLSLRICR